MIFRLNFLYNFHFISKTSYRCYSSRHLSYIHHVGKDPLRNIALGSLLDEIVVKYGDRPALISKHQKKTLTFSEVLIEADKLAAGLKAIGLEKGERVGIYLPNQYEWYITMMGCTRAGLTLVALNPFYQPSELEYCINKVSMKAIVCGHQFKTQNYYDIMQSVAPSILKDKPGELRSGNIPSLRNVISVTEKSLPGAYNYQEILDMSTDVAVKNIKDNQRFISADELNNIQMTSGTTGKPKATMISHFNLVNNSFEIAKRFELYTKHHTLCVQVPLFHGYGTTITICTALHFGTTLVLPGYSYNPNESLDAIRDEKCTVVNGTPTMHIDLVDVQTKRNENISLEMAVSGGALCSPHLFERMLNVLKVKQVKSVYGLSETTGVVFHSLPGEDVVESTTTVGHVGDHLEVKVVDKEGNLVAFGEPGELCIRGYANMLGYWNDKGKTEEMIGPDGWLKTGDQFILESNGYGRVVGRLKDVIIRGGENVFPKEIEDFLITHPGIIEVYVIGLDHERLGEEVCACVRVKDGVSLTLEDLKRFCAGKLSYFKIPSVLRFFENFPTTTSGKIQKFILKELAQKSIEK